MCGCVCECLCARAPLRDPTVSRFPSLCSSARQMTSCSDLLPNGPAHPQGAAPRQPPSQRRQGSAPRLSLRFSPAGSIRAQHALFVSANRTQVSSSSSFSSSRELGHSASLLGRIVAAAALASYRFILQCFLFTSSYIAALC